MKLYEIFFAKQALKDVQSLSPKLKEKLKKLLIEVIAQDPYVGKKLVGELEGNYSYRLNIKDRLVYSIDPQLRRIYVKRARTHYGE
ncbi:MAG: Addiction module toxin, Txe/YoeB family [Candidatus Peregrinibacteria bacterium GW2011_GWA2_44_7]|nr:MAG: Addiction module toxin, Txe/YoeB family [Candidatus Peregrinibacteria bacterium GW2011_GWA2_44_7]